MHSETYRTKVKNEIKRIQLEKEQREKQREMEIENAKDFKNKDWTLRIYFRKICKSHDGHCSEASSLHTDKDVNEYETVEDIPIYVEKKHTEPINEFCDGLVIVDKSIINKLCSDNHIHDYYNGSGYCGYDECISFRSNYVKCLE